MKSKLIIASLLYILLAVPLFTKAENAPKKGSNSHPPKHPIWPSAILSRRHLTDTVISPKAIKLAIKAVADTFLFSTYQDKSMHPMDFFPHI
jgi:hypothetical protein